LPAVTSVRTHTPSRTTSTLVSASLTDLRASSPISFCTHTRLSFICPTHRCILPIQRKVRACWTSCQSLRLTDCDQTSLLIEHYLSVEFQTRSGFRSIATLVPASRTCAQCHSSTHEDEVVRQASPNMQSVDELNNNYVKSLAPLKWIGQHVKLVRQMQAD
jgi:hypothetical protein